MLPALGASVPVLRPRGAALGLARLLRRHNASEAAQDAASAALERCTRAPDADARAVASACRELLQAMQQSAWSHSDVRAILTLPSLGKTLGHVVQLLQWAFPARGPPDAVAALQSLT